MSYTIPEFVDTPEQAILAVASAVKGEQVTGGDGNVGTALDLLADALAGEDVEVPMTQQGAILALAQYVAGMVKPEGTITITENGEDIDVAQYATADVSVSGGGTTTADVWFWNSNEDENNQVRPDTVKYLSGFSGGVAEWSTLTFESVTTTVSDVTYYGIKISDAPVGGILDIGHFDADVYLDTAKIFVTDQHLTYDDAIDGGGGEFTTVPAPFEGLYLDGYYMVSGII